MFVWVVLTMVVMVWLCVWVVGMGVVGSIVVVDVLITEITI